MILEIFQIAKTCLFAFIFCLGGGGLCLSLHGCSMTSQDLEDYTDDVPKYDHGADAGYQVYDLPDGLHGQTPDGNLALPVFSGVLNHENKVVSAEDLLGHWSILWFYPAASTTG